MRNSIQRIDRRWLILFSIIPVACLVALILGVLVGEFVFPLEMLDGQISTMSEAETEEFVKMVAAEYAVDGDAEKARTRLKELGLPRPEQYVAFLADSYIQQGRAPDDQDLIRC